MRLPLVRLEPDGRPTVLATAGGGEDGFTILEAFIEAGGRHELARNRRRRIRRARRRKRQELRAAAERGGVTYHTFVRGLDAWFDVVDCLVCMGGLQHDRRYALRAARPRSASARGAAHEAVDPRRGHLASRTYALRPPGAPDGRACAEEVRSALEDSRADLRARAQESLGFDGAEQRREPSLIELATPDEIAPGSQHAMSGDGRHLAQCA